MQTHQPGKRGRKRKNPVENDDDSNSVKSFNENGEGDEENGAEPRKAGPGRPKRRRYTHHIPPPSGIVTRGVAVPDYSSISRGGSGGGRKTLASTSTAEVLGPVRVNVEAGKKESTPQPSPKGTRKRGRPPKNKVSGRKAATKRV